MRKSITVFFLLTFVSLISCKKEEQKSNTELLCGKYWKINALTSDSEIPVRDDDGNIIGYTHDFFSGLSACAKDDLIMYSADGTYIFDAKTLCSPEEHPNGTGTWVYNSDETVITKIQYDGFIMEYTNVELSDGKFKCRFDFVLPDVTYKLAATFTHE
jgi:hypothetical protein